MNRSCRERPARPDADRMGDWLGSSDVVCPSGAVWSWHNPAHPGFKYPEAAAIWLSWASWRKESGLASPCMETVNAVARTLAIEIVKEGGIGRNGDRYLFDTCVAVHGLVRAGRAFGSEYLDFHGFERLLDGIEAFFRADSPIIPGPRADCRWSMTWDIHLVRGAALLAVAGRLMGDERTVDAAKRIRSRSDAASRDSGRTYVHSLAYGIEGELLFRSMPGRQGTLSPEREAARMAEIQGHDGHIPAWTDGSGGPRADATAQAVRIWVCVDRSRFERATQKSVEYLAARQSGAGGIEYTDGSGDLNTWVTAFADQAVAWKEGGADPMALI